MSDTAIETSADLRTFLLNEMVDTAKGLRHPATAKAVCNYAQQIYNTMNLEMRHAHVIAKHGGVNLPPVQLKANNGSVSPNDI